VAALALELQLLQPWEFRHFYSNTVRILVRIDPPHPLVCPKRRLNGAVIRMRPEKLRSSVTVKSKTFKIGSDCSFVKSTEFRSENHGSFGYDLEYGGPVSR
jgi:hypothetical protein